MRIKITSDGTGRWTRIVDAETGEELKDVCAVSIEVVAHNLVKAVLEFDSVEFEIEALAKARDVGSLLEGWLKRNGYDGLYCSGECACEIGSLQPCESGMLDCEPGYKTKCRCGQGCDWDIGPKRDNKDGE